MEKVKISELKSNLQRVFNESLSEKEHEAMREIQDTVKSCAPRFLRITKMDKFVRDVIKKKRN